MALKTLLNTTAITLSAIVIVSCGGGSGGSSAPPPPPPPPPPDTSAPRVSFSPASLTVISTGTGTSNLMATDNVAVTSGPTVSCTNGGSFSAGTFTAPAVTSTTISECTATASDAAGNQGTATLTVTINPDTTAPIITFNPVSLMVASGQTATSTLTATDDVGVTSGPTVSCTNGGSFASNTFTAPTVTASTVVECTATASDAAGNSADGMLVVTVTPPPATVTIDGKITFDRVPFNTTTNGLDYAATTQTPAPGITVEAQSATGTVLASDITDVNGDYSVTVNPNTDLRIVAKAEMVQTTGAQWDVQVIDNTSSNALYQLAGSVVSSGTSDSTRNLNAGSGWGGSSYTGVRNAAPFAILAPIYTSIQKIVAVDSDVVFPPARFNWSVSNRAANGNLANGEIGTSSYRGNGQIYILGDANQDTDEYDTHVVIHEWGHYFEDQMSRSDSIGGSHSGGQKLDPRVAMGEGFGNALSGIMTDDPFYRDSNGGQQSGGFSINVETNRPAGWFDESTVQSVLYDIYDAADDDTLSLGLAPIYEVFTADAYKDQPVFTTIFSFLSELRSQQASSAAAIDIFAATRGINSTAADGAGETNDGSTPTSLPVYKDVTVGGGAVQVCSNNDNGVYNKLANRAYLKFTAAAGSHTLTMTRSSGATSRDPDFIVYKNGAVVARAENPPAESESTTATLTAGEHVIDAYDFANAGQGQGVAGDACYNFTITGP